tara:strand:- start:2782 stop:6186 length:3405 start_codon:yes stop_codon:yes gene_type:complete
MINDQYIQLIIDKYFNQENIFVSHQIDSYNDLIDNILPKILSQSFPISIDFKNDKILNISISVTNIKIERPYYTENNGCSKIMTPNIARLRNYTYSLSVIIDVGVNYSIIENDIKIIPSTKHIQNILLCKIPIIVKSKYCVYKDDIFSECKYDLGGYTIINGNEKVLITQEKIIPNIIQIYELTKANSKYSFVSEVRSCPSINFGMTKTTTIKITNKILTHDNNIYISFPRIKNDIPISIIFKALGCITDKEILYHIIDNDNSEEEKNMIQILYKSLFNKYDCNTENDAINYISKYINHSNVNFSQEMKKDYCKNIIKKDLLPHLGNNNKKKINFIGLMINKLIKCYMGLIEPSNRDSYQNKRMEPAGILMGNLIYQGMNKITKDIKIYITKEVATGLWIITNDYQEIINELNISKMIKSNYIENILKSALATGNWGMKNNINKQGVSQVLNRLTFMSTLSHLRRISTPVDSTGKLIAPRKLQNTQWGYICPTETPEGQSVGVVKNLSMTCEITSEISDEIILYYLKKYIIDINDIDIFKENKNNYIKIFINGDWIGYTNEPNELYLNFKKDRFNNLIHHTCSIEWDYINNSIYIFSDRGRCIRPLLINKKFFRKNIDSLKNKSWSELLINNDDKYIEYIDIHEVNNILLSTNLNDKSKKYTHYEIDPSLILGSLASCIPFLNHNQAPRNTYQSAMGKQAIGIPLTNYNHRYDTFSHILHYPQKPIINTKMMKYFNFNAMPNGINVIIAIATYSGYNQEDSVIINQSAIDRGIFSSSFYRTYKEEEKKDQLTGEEDKFCSPDIDKLLFPKPANYEKIESDGLVKENTYISSDDIIIGKIIPIKKDKHYLYRDCSTTLRPNENGFIDKNYLNRNNEGYRFCNVRTRKVKIPQIGDKFSSRHGQKGTVGMTYLQEDMPRTKDGIVPDIIMNPHAVPSRMTIAQLLECILGKSCSELGYHGDGTGFNNTDVNDIIQTLEKCGYEGSGNEILYNGFNGEQMKTSIFIGPTYYQRLKHMSADKVHSRASGPIVSMTRQPAEGRIAHGGLRFGEMERDCMIAHGTASFLKERLMDVSDKYNIFICNECKIIATGNNKNNIYECKKCNNYSNFTKVYIPYAFKLLLQELMTMSIGPRIITN